MKAFKKSVIILALISFFALNSQADTLPETLANLIPDADPITHCPDIVAECVANNETNTPKLGDDSSASIDTTITVWGSTDYPLYPLTGIAAYYVPINNPLSQGGDFSSFYLRPNETRHMPPKQGYYVAIGRAWGAIEGQWAGANTFFSTCNNMLQIMANQSQTLMAIKIRGPKADFNVCDVYPVPKFYFN